MTNLQISKLLRAVAAALSLSKGDNRFRVLAYERAADAIEHASSEVKDLWDDNRLSELSGVGESITAHLDELFTTGQVKHFTQILKSFPSAIFELLEIPGIGTKTAYKLCQHLGITNAHSAVSDLEKAARKGHIRALEGFGVDSEADILRSIQEYKGRSRRLLLPAAQDIADSVIAWLTRIPQVKEAHPLGSLRRQVSTIGDIDISVASDDPQSAINHFLAYPHRSRILEAGEHTASLILPNDYQVDLMVQPPASYGSLLQHFTGSKHHNILLREYALKKGYSLSEYGIKTNGQLKKFPTEEKFYEFLGLDWIPPELREGNGEVEKAKNHTLPTLIELSDIKGDLQIHSNIDVNSSHDTGTSSVSELAVTAHKLGYDYIGLTEHNPKFSGQPAHEILEIIKKKTNIIQKFNSENRSEKRAVFVFNSLEIDIQPSGTRALPDSCLDLLDYACVSIHSSFRLPRKQMTDRVLSALDHPKVKFFAHPTARLLGEREGIDLDWDKIFDFCIHHDKWLEIDGWPNRLDLPDVLVKEAIEHGIKLVINTDSHNAESLSFMRYGVSVARRGWATADVIINTCPLSQMKKLLY